MKTVGIKQLKARLSEYVRLVRRGETLLVTERDEVVAELRPARRQLGLPDELAAVLDQLAEGGQVTRAALPKAGWRWEVEPLGLPAGSTLTLLDELRAERG